MKYQKHCRERGVKEMHVENDKNICCEVEKGMEKMYATTDLEIIKAITDRMIQ